MSPADSPFAQLPAPGPHPATEELRAYAAGTLSPAQQHHIEAHALDCERCADLAAGFSMSDAATTDQAVATLRTRLQARTGTPAPAPPAPHWAWPRVAAAAALLGIVAGSIWTWEEHQAAAPVSTRTESSQPLASAKTASSEAETASAPAVGPESALEATAAIAPEEADKAEYAAVAPAQPARAASPRPARRPMRRSTRQLGRSALAKAEPKVAADKEPAADVAMTQALTKEREVAAEQNAAAPAPAAASVAAVPAKQADPELRARPDTATDLTKAASPAPVASKAAAAHVAVTPMPAAPSIKPAPVGGSPALREYIRREVAEFEPEPNAPQLTGTVRVQFVVEPDGKLSNLRVTRGLRPDYDAEALRIICEGPAWQPGISRGRRAPLPMEINVPF